MGHMQIPAEGTELAGFEFTRWDWVWNDFYENVFCTLWEVKTFYTAASDGYLQEQIISEYFNRTANCE